ncbi:hypothetical protein N7G274_007477 [Stereocaulon virgatum]|uniref:Retrograde regulation protein 2 n=1 Tax=Stereocaulon virgatum TaxID=373712 RepID=A0ABR4A3J4_9LECA
MGFSTVGQHYQALVDIGSNGIRFSISDLSPPHSRSMPTIYQDRSGISLYDAQISSGTKVPIPAAVIEDVLTALQRFKRICRDFGVDDSNVRVVATEATRNAINRDHLLNEIGQRTGWKVQLLAKEEEGRLGAMGIASSIDYVEGICMDMGGGSVQLTWVIKQPNGHIEMGPSVSFPYGAAALISALSKLGSQSGNDLQADITTKLEAALENDLRIPSTLLEAAKQSDGFNIYLSGGGFRGWGFLLMSNDKNQPYPIPIINGYSVSSSTFFSKLSEPPPDVASHRISSRRQSQIPAIQLLIRALAQSQMHVSTVTFAQGGVREGLLYGGLPLSVRAQSSFVAATLTYTPPSAAALLSLLRNATPECIDHELLASTVNLLYVHGPVSKDVRACAALRSTTTGILASANGLSHRNRAFLALVLCERWGAGVPNADTEFLFSITRICGPSISWWAKYIGRIAQGIGNLYPAGVVRDDDNKVALEAIFPPAKRLGWDKGSEALGSQTESCHVKFTILSNDIETVGLVNQWATDLTKLGKKKHWDRDILGLPVNVEVTRKGI